MYLKNKFRFILSLLVLTLISCDSGKLLEVEVAGEVLEEDIANPNNAPMLVNSAIADFECAFGHYIVAAGLLGFEFRDSQLSASLWDYDRRTLDPSAGGLYATGTCTDFLGLYTPLSTAAWHTNNVYNLLSEWSDQEVSNKEEFMAEIAAYSGFSILLLGESMQSAALYGGPELTREELFQESVDRFTTAINHAENINDSEILNMSFIGRARAYLNLGQPQNAEDDAVQVEEGFVKNATYSSVSSRRENKVYTMNIQDDDVTVFEPYRNLEFEGVSDQRVNLIETGQNGDDNITPMWYQTKYESMSDPIPIARWEEAQLIIAEVRGGQDAVNIINLLHEDANLPDFDSNNEEEIMEHLIQERQRELFLESHHLGDLNRYDLPLIPEPGTDYPSKAGGIYGDMKQVPLPDVERLNNPDI